MDHYCKIKDISIKTNLKPEEAYAIAKKFHKENKIAGEIPEDINKAMSLDECYYITNGVAWMIFSKLPPNPFEGMEDFTLVVSDEYGIVCEVLDHNCIPMDKYHTKLNFISKRIEG